MAKFVLALNVYRVVVFGFFMCVALHIEPSSLRKVARTYEVSSSPHHENNRAFFRQAALGFDPLLEQLLEKGVSIDVRDSSGATALHYAATQKDVVLARFLLRNGATVTIKNFVGQTALHKAVMLNGRSQSKQTEELVRLLLDAGAHRESIDGAGNTPLEYALRENSESLVNILLGGAQDTPTVSAHSVAAAPQEKTVQGADESNTSSASLDDEVAPPDRWSINDLASRKFLYAALKKEDFSEAKVILIKMALSEVLQKGALSEAHQYFTVTLFPTLNMLLRVCLPYLGRYTHMKKICSIDVWRVRLMLIFFDDLLRGHLPDIPQVLEAQDYAVKFLEGVLENLVVQVERMVRQEKPTVLKPSIIEFLDSKKIREVFEESIKSEISLRRAQNAHQDQTPYGIFDHIAYFERAAKNNIRDTNRYSPDVI